MKTLAFLFLVSLTGCAFNSESETLESDVIIDDSDNQTEFGYGSGTKSAPAINCGEIIWSKKDNNKIDYVAFCSVQFDTGRPPDVNQIVTIPKVSAP